jgi:hypothetical protein
MSWFEYFCDEIGPNITVSNRDARYMTIHFYVIDIDNNIFLAICDIHTYIYNHVLDEIDLII